MSKRLKRADWIAHGFEVLRCQGHEGLKADTMAKALNVSRGSFYWHFPSLQEFHTALLTAWREQITEAVIAELNQLPDDQDPLEKLIERAIQTPQYIEVAMRRWGGVDPAVARAVLEVDERRMAYLVNLFEQTGAPLDEAQSRATLLTWAFIGRAFAPSFADELPSTTAAHLSTMMQGPKRNQAT